MPRLLVPDNAKVAVIKACLYEPQVNRTYAEMAAHYPTPTAPADGEFELVVDADQTFTSNAGG